jgi:APA family basic amino acid/polyamine antiporter
LNGPDKTSQKKIGLLSSLALVIGNMIGSGVFLLPATLAAFGGVGIIGWVFSSVGAILLALVFGNLSSILPKSSGGPYAYTKVGLGEFPAYLVAWGYWISIWCTNAAIAVALVGYLGVLFPVLTSNVYSSVATGLFFVWFFTWINSKPIRTIGIVQIFTTILKIVPLLMLGLIGIFYINTEHLFPTTESTDSLFVMITATTTLTFFAFLGMESATIPSGNIANPEKTIKRATILGTIITAALYMLSFVAVLGIVPAESLMKSDAPFADAASIIWGDFGKYLVAIGAIISTMGALNGWILIQGQIPMAAAKDDLFPKVFKRTNKNNSPIIGIVISSVLASVLMLFNYSKSLADAFKFMMLLSTLSVLTPYLFSIATYALLTIKRGSKKIVQKLILSILAFSFSIWIIIGCGEEIVFYGFLLLLLGIPFYVLMKNNAKN